MGMEFGLKRNGMVLLELMGFCYRIKGIKRAVSG